MTPGTRGAPGEAAMTPETGDGRALYLLDGSSFLFRAFFALPEDLATSSGLVTNAVHGFVSMVMTILRDRRPAGLAVAFDGAERTFRSDIVPEYKAQRGETPPALLPQFELARRFTEGLGVPALYAPGFEADDILATLATLARDAGREAVVVSGDRDTFQLVEDPFVKVLYTRKGLSDVVLYDEAGIEERTGVPPSLYPLVAALRGDPSDNLQGVAGVGEKTAAKLALEYRDLDSLYGCLAALSPKLRSSLEAASEQVRRNLKATILVRDLPLGRSLGDLDLGHHDTEVLKQLLLEELEMKTAWGRLAPLLGGGPTPLPVGLAGSGAAVHTPGRDGRLEGDGPMEVPGGVVASEQAIGGGQADRYGFPVQVECLLRAGRGAAEAVRGLAAIAAGPVVTLGCYPAEGSPEGMLLAGSVAGTAKDVEVLAVPDELLADPGVRAAVAKILVGQSGEVKVASHGAKRLMRYLLGFGIDFRALWMDCEVAGYLLDPSSRAYGVEDLCGAYLGGRPEVSVSGNGPGGIDQAVSDLIATGVLARPLEAELQRTGLARLYDLVEQPLVVVLARMEHVGIGADAQMLSRMAEELEGRAEELAREVKRLAGFEFNVNSTKELREVLYGAEHLSLSTTRRKKTGLSTDARALEKLRGAHPAVDALLAYREVEKLRSTYGENLVAQVAPDGRIHATFHQTATRTGRISSDKPNLHNIPVRSEVGRRIREAFVPAPGFRFVVADYDQIELRILAHLSSDPGLTEAFREGRDVHAEVAARVYGVPTAEVTPFQRSRAKMVSYGLSYGMETFGLADRLATSNAEAQGILDAFFGAFPALHDYMLRSVTEARRKGYAETLFGRRRPLPDLGSYNRVARQAAERQALNAGVQGLAADIFKLALVRLDRALGRAPVESRIVLQIHDEVIVETLVGEGDGGGGGGGGGEGDGGGGRRADSGGEKAVEQMVRSVLCGAGDEAGLSVPLEVSMGSGMSWFAARPS